MGATFPNEFLNKKACFRFGQDRPGRIKNWYNWKQRARGILQESFAKSDNPSEIEIQNLLKKLENIRYGVTDKQIKNWFSCNRFYKNNRLQKELVNELIDKSVEQNNSSKENLLRKYPETTRRFKDKFYSTQKDKNIEVTMDNFFDEIKVGNYEIDEDQFSSSDSSSSSDTSVSQNSNVSLGLTMSDTSVSTMDDSEHCKNSDYLPTLPKLPVYKGTINFQVAIDFYRNPPSPFRIQKY